MNDNCDGDIGDVDNRCESLCAGDYCDWTTAAGSRRSARLSFPAWLAEN